jgi:CheY-like chemotaxis protein
MFVKEWEILVVDDDEDMLQITSLALKDVRVNGAPLKIHTARSKAEGLELIHGKLLTKGGFSNIHVALIDVVMETDTAGLDLCEAIRAADTNYNTQIYVRTGQPGVAPERDVIDRYEINGYFSKVEMTENKLYSLVTAGLRQSSYIAANAVLSKLQSMLIEAKSLEGMTKVLKGLIQRLETTTDGATINTVQFDIVFMEGDHVIAGREEVAVVKTRLQHLPGVAIGNAGDRYIIDDAQLLIHVQPSETTSEFFFAVGKSSGVRLATVPLYYNFLRSLAALWKQSSLEPQMP